MQYTSHIARIPKYEKLIMFLLYLALSLDVKCFFSRKRKCVLKLPEVIKIIGKNIIQNIKLPKLLKDHYLNSRYGVVVTKFY